MKNFPGLSFAAPIKETGGSQQSCVAGRIQSRLGNREATKKRAHMLYAIGELREAARLFCELAAARQGKQAEGHGEAIHG